MTEDQKKLPEGFRIDFPTRGQVYAENGGRIEIGWIKDVPVEHYNEKEQRYTWKTERKWMRVTSCTIQYSPLACCGIKVLTGMNWLYINERFPHAAEEDDDGTMLRHVLAEMVRFLRGVFVGGNVCFVLNRVQREWSKKALAIMRETGTLHETQFNNHNMKKPNYMYVWDFKQHGGENYVG